MALEQLLRLKEDQLQTVKLPVEEEDADRKVKKLVQRVQLMKAEKKKDQEVL